MIKQNTVKCSQVLNGVFVRACMCVYSPQLQTAQALTKLHTHFHTWPRHLADPALASASQGSSKRITKVKNSEDRTSH